MENRSNISIDIKELVDKKSLALAAVSSILIAIFKLLESVPVLGILFMLLVYLTMIKYGILVSYYHDYVGKNDKALDVIKKVLLGAIIIGFVAGIIESIIPRSLGFNFVYNIPLFSAVLGNLLASLVLSVTSSILMLFIKKESLPKQIIELLEKAKETGKKFIK